MNEELNPPEVPVQAEPKVVRYFVHFDGETRGPFTLAQLQGEWRRRRIPESAQVCPAGSDVWVEIGTMRDRLDFNPVDRHFTAPVEERKRQRLKRRGKRGKKTALLLILAIVFVLGAVAAAIYFAGVAF